MNMKEQLAAGIASAGCHLVRCPDCGQAIGEHPDEYPMKHPNAAEQNRWDLWSEHVSREECTVGPPLGEGE